MDCPLPRPVEDGDLDRISVARERVQLARSEVLTVTEFPCIQCRHYSLACTHPAVSKAKPDPVSGGVRFEHADAVEARAENGPCGPEGALFEHRSLPGSVAVYFLSTASGRWILGIGALVTGAYLFG
jgi:hypothetical protein